MVRAKSKKDRFLYAIISDDVDECYIGITTCVRDRVWLHRTRGTRAVKKILDGRHSVVVLAVGSPTDMAEAERQSISGMRAIGVRVVNKMLGGDLGFSIQEVWTKKAALSEAKKYRSNTEFRKNCPSAYAACARHGWLELAAEHHEFVTKSNGRRVNKHTEATRVHRLAAKFNSVIEFRRSARTYNSAIQVGIADKIIAAITERQKKSKSLYSPVDRIHASHLEKL